MNYRTKHALRRLCFGASIAGALPFSAAAGHAEVATANLNVSATVTQNCTVSTTALGFGNVNTLSASNVDGTGGLSVTCTSGTGWTASADAGSGSGATFASRRMTAGSDLLSYSLYTDAARSTVWGDGAGSTGTFTGTGSGSGQAVTVYGRVPSGQTSAPAGAYSDVVAVTITY